MWAMKIRFIHSRIVLLLLSILFLVPQIYVMLLPHSERYCGPYHMSLLSLLIVSIITTFLMIAFCVVFSVMDPVPYQIKITFHVYGLFCAVLCIVHTTLTLLGSICSAYAPELYMWSVILMDVSLISMVFFMITVPFWLINRRWTNSVYDKNEQIGLCYSPVKCCSCIWHI